MLRTVDLGGCGWAVGMKTRVFAISTPHDTASPLQGQSLVGVRMARDTSERLDVAQFEAPVGDRGHPRVRQGTPCEPGPAVPHRNDGDPSVRGFGDIDIVVHPRSWATAVDTMIAAGCYRRPTRRR